MECTVCGLYFTSNFDSGNLARVERATRDDEDSQRDVAPSASATSGLLSLDPKPDYEVNVWTRQDCAGTQYENRNRSWFYFGIHGGSFGKTIKINIMNLNRQGKLYSQGHVPMVRSLPGKVKWERIREKPLFENSDNNMTLSFVYRFVEVKPTSMVYFAFTYPWSYVDCQQKLAELDLRFRSCSELTSKSPRSSIYYKRELLCRSLDGLRIDLITVSDCHGLTDMEEPRFDDSLFPDQGTRRCKWISGKKVFFVSSRVHPGETPGSYVFNGFFDFILREDDPRAIQLRRQYVFKLVPMLNPDGVVRGHYRTDTRGVNLNRVYLDPSPDLHPSIYAVKTLLVFHHVNNRIRPATGDSFPSSGFWVPSANILSSTSTVDLSSNDAISEDANTEAGAGCSAVATEPSVSVIQFADSSSVRQTVSEPIETHAQDFSAHTSPSPNSLSYHPKADQFAPPPDSNANAEKNSTDSIENMTAYQQNEAGKNFPLDAFGDYERPGNVPCVRKRDSIASYNDIASGGECEDFDSETDHLGNEGSDDEVDTTQVTEGFYSPHLSHPSLRTIPSASSGIALYVDLHAHASKRGCFMYGNYLDDDDEQADNVLYARLIAINSAHFDFDACNFTERNMYTPDKKEGLTKEGSGRVALYKALGIINCYTLECNYNTGRIVNVLPMACGDSGRATPPPLAGLPPKYTPTQYEEVGRAVAVSALDITDTNPWSRLTVSEYTNVQCLRDVLRRQLHASRAIVARCTVSKPSRAIVKGTSGIGTIPRVAMLAARHGKTVQSSTSSTSESTALSNSLASRTCVNFVARKTASSVNRKELAHRSLPLTSDKQRHTAAAAGASQTAINSSSLASGTSRQVTVMATTSSRLPSPTSQFSPNSAPSILDMGTMMAPPVMPHTRNPSTLTDTFSLSERRQHYGQSQKGPLVHSRSAEVISSAGSRKSLPSRLADIALLDSKQRRMFSHSQSHSAQDNGHRLKSGFASDDSEKVTFRESLLSAGCVVVPPTSRASDCSSVVAHSNDSIVTVKFSILKDLPEHSVLTPKRSPPLGEVLSRKDRVDLDGCLALRSILESPTTAELNRRSSEEASASGVQSSTGIGATAAAVNLKLTPPNRMITPPPGFSSRMYPTAAICRVAPGAKKISRLLVDSNRNSKHAGINESLVASGVRWKGSGMRQISELQSNLQLVPGSQLSSPRSQHGSQPSTRQLEIPASSLERGRPASSTTRSQESHRRAPGSKGAPSPKLMADSQRFTNTKLVFGSSNINMIHSTQPVMISFQTPLQPGSTANPSPYAAQLSPGARPKVSDRLHSASCVSGLSSRTRNPGAKGRSRITAKFNVPPSIDGVSIGQPPITNLLQQRKVSASCSDVSENALRKVVQGSLKKPVDACTECPNASSSVTSLSRPSSSKKSSTFSPHSKKPKQRNRRRPAVKQKQPAAMECDDNSDLAACDNEPVPVQPVPVQPAATNISTFWVPF